MEVVRGEIGEYKTYDVRCEADHPDTFGVLMDQEIGVITSIMVSMLLILSTCARVMVLSCNGKN